MSLARASFHRLDWRSPFCLPESERLKEQYWEHLLTDALLLFSGPHFIGGLAGGQEGPRGQPAARSQSDRQTLPGALPSRVLECWLRPLGCSTHSPLKKISGCFQFE